MSTQMFLVNWSAVTAIWSVIAFCVLKYGYKYPAKWCVWGILAVFILTLTLLHREFENLRSTIKHYDPTNARFLELSLVPFIVLFLAVGVAKKWNRSLKTDYTSFQACLADWFSVPTLIGFTILFALLIITTTLSPLILALLGVIILSLYPAYYLAVSDRSELGPAGSNVADNANQPQAENLAVLGMIESGKISASEGAELLAALSLSPPIEPKLEKPLPRLVKLQALGLLLIVAGFFLPWAKINVREEMWKLMASQVPDKSLNTFQLPNTLQQMIGQARENKSAGVDVKGFDINYAWIILVGALVSLTLHFLKTELTPRTTRLILGGCQVAIALTLIIIAGKLVKFIQPGILVVLIGVMLQGVAAVRLLKTTR